MSIRTYLFTLLTGLVLIIAVVLSYQSGRLFISSFDMAVQSAMYKIGQQYPNNGQGEQTILDYHVTTDWHKVPSAVRKRFPEIPTERNIHFSIFEDWVYIAPPKRAYSLMVVERDNKQIFISRFHEDIHEKIKREHDHDSLFIDPMVVVVLVGLAAIIIFALMLLYAFKKVSVPMESLQQWAKKLSIADLDKPLPKFRFKELNSLAKLIHNNLASVADSIKREQNFLNYASHELRTPIAVLRSNSALLEKVNPTPSAKERLVRDRIQRASLTMKSMTETLLWLSRDGESEMPVERMCLGDMITTISHELDYLLSGKSVSIELAVDSKEIELAVTPSIIVLNNLIRNAFQHTQSGQVNISQQGSEVKILNIESEQGNGAKIQDELGFGLGMQLVEKLTKQFGWQYKTLEMTDGYQVSIKFEQ